MSRSVLVIEDQQDLAKLVKRHLQDLSCNVKLTFDGTSGLAEAEAKSYDLIILDLMLPGIGGLEICRRLRGKANYTPILMLTAKDTELDRVLGLELGADDYLTKPFSMLELMARVKAIFRRSEVLAATGSGVALQAIQIGELSVDAEKRQATLGEKVLDLTSKEFDLLLHFARNPGKPYTRMQLLDMVWGYGHDGYEHAVNCLINRLRAKIEENHARPKYILTVWAVGYKMADLPAAERN
jgi:DNA-binding response OmpR family regulator